MSISDRQVHIVNPFWSAAGGSEWRALTLYEALKNQCAVHLWSEYEPDPRLSAEYPINRIALRQGKYPKRGVLVFVGAYFCPKLWIWLARPKRIVIVYNTVSRKEFWFTRGLLAVRGLRNVEVVYASERLKETLGLPGVVEPSLIDTEKFAPASRTSENDRAEFVVGRLSRDVPEKHHADDPQFYRRLAEQDFQVKIMGGTCLADALDAARNVSLLPACAVEPRAFLQDLDCFFYRTSDEWIEPFGRVVFEAMACGLPVVCRNRGGYVDLIEHTRNGYLFETDDEAFEILIRLKNDPILRRSVGMAARRTVENAFSPARRAEIAGYYLP